jgi:tetratricopeptide (TPR) repeat protein
MTVRATVLMACLSLLPAATAAAAAADSRTVGDLGKVGTVSFPISCDPSLQADFERGVALLHSFFYAEARRVFESIAARDPECAMAHWGIAMSYYHMIWAPPDSAELAAGMAAAKRALAARKQSERERGYIAAILAYYEGDAIAPVEGLPPPQASAPSCHGGPGPDFRGRAACFLREIEKVAAKHPDDVDAAAFYALSLLGNAPPGDGDLKLQTKAASLLEPWYAQRPQHPGLVHYLIHSYDYPATAKKGLDAALAYADIAPWVPHALHMPSHIFTRLGMWDETIRSNLAAAEAGRRLAPAPDIGYFEELHALDYAIYGYLQTGRDAEAKRVVERIASLKGTYPAVDLPAAFAFGAIPARYVLERRAWREASELSVPPMPFWERLPFSKGHIVYANAVGAAMAGDLERARAAARELGVLSDAATDARFAYFKFLMSIQQRTALGLIAIAEGHRDDGLALLAGAAAAEDSIGKSGVSPGAMLPARELYAEALLDAGRPREAFAEFEASLKIYPRRFNGVQGAARAADRAGMKREAAAYYEQLLELAKGGDGARPGIAEARARLKKS